MMPPNLEALLLGNRVKHPQSNPQLPVKAPAAVRPLLRVVLAVAAIP